MADLRQVFSAPHPSGGGSGPGAGTGAAPVSSGGGAAGGSVDGSVRVGGSLVGGGPQLAFAAPRVQPGIPGFGGGLLSALGLPRLPGADVRGVLRGSAGGPAVSPAPAGWGVHPLVAFLHAAGAFEPFPS